ncbi:MAG: hypothetical protein H7832_04925 [Magnetococcus sp. DMHC-6]
MKIEIFAAPQLDQMPPWEAPLIFVMPSLDLEMAGRCAGLLASRSGENGVILIVHDTLGEGFIQVCNRAFRRSRCEFFGYVAQDAYPGRAWLMLGKRALVQNNKSLLAFNDGKWHGLLASFGLVRRSWALNNYAGELFYPGYKRHYADAELTLLAKNDHTLCYDPRSLLVEVDWEKEMKGVDHTDKALFKRRAATLFDGRVTDPQYCQIFPRDHMQ